MANNGIQRVLLLLAVILGSCLTGLAIAKGWYIAPALWLGLFAGGVLLQISDSRAFLLLGLLSTIIQGLIEYYAGFAQFAWFSYAMAGLLGLRLLLRVFAGKTDFKLGPWQLLLLLALVTLLFASLLQLSPVMQMIVALKTFLLCWLVAFYLMQSPMKDEEWASLWQCLPVLLLIQLPFVIHQHFFIALGRGAVGWDAVVGTFGGNPQSGGLSGVLTLFAVWIMSSAYARYQQGIGSGAKLAGLTLAGLVVILLGEVKIVVIWIPLAILCIHGLAIFKRLGRMLLLSGVLALFVVTVGLAYQKMYWEVEGQKSASDSVTNSLKYVFDDSLIDPQSGEVSRAASLAIWWKDRQQNGVTLLIGNGMGASNSTGSIKGAVAKRYGSLDIGSTALARFLWDMGMIGSLAMLAGLALASWQGFSLSKQTARFSPQQIANLRSAATGIMLLLSTIIYNATLANELSTQLMMAFCLGYIGSASRWAQGKEQ